MGNQSDKGKKNNGLRDLAKISNPIMPTTDGRACIIEDGKIVFNFRHYKEDYKSLNENLEKLKNKMNIIISDELIEMIQIRFENLKKYATNEELKTSIDSISSKYKKSLNNYYNLLGEIKKVYKETYMSIASFLTNWLKTQKKAETNGEIAKIEEFEKKLGNLKNNFDNFKEIEDIVNKICCFKIDYNNNNDKMKEINKYYEENKDEIEKTYKFENMAQFRSLLNLKEQIIDTINQKNNFVDVLSIFHNDYLSIYKKVISNKLHKSRKS